MIDLFVSFILTWILAAIVLMIVDRLEIGLSVGGFGRAVVAALVIAIVNLILGTLLQAITWPIDKLTCGWFSWLFNWIIAGIVLYVSAKLVKGFEITNFVSAIVVALVLGIIGWASALVAGALFG